LTTCFPSNTKDLGEKYKDYMSQDTLHRLLATNQNPDIQFRPNVFNEAMILIEEICLSIANKALVKLGVPSEPTSERNVYDRTMRAE